MASFYQEQALWLSRVLAVTEGSREGTVWQNEI